jgi:hypothetical protein
MLIPLGGSLRSNLGGFILRSTRYRALLCAAAILIAGCGPGWAATRTFCGKATGTAGNRYLSDAKGDVIELARQGGDQRLADQTDALLEKLGKDKSGEIGMQNGTRYCVVAKLDNRGRPVAVIRAYRAKSARH